MSRSARSTRCDRQFCRTSFCGCRTRPGTVLFVTHSIDEAVLLSDRVVIMGTKPGRVKQIVPINLPRPRQPEEIRALPEFGALRNFIWASIREESLEAA